MSHLYTIIDPRFRRYAMDNATLETLATGFRWLEGPVWCGDHDSLIFSDIPNDRILRWTGQGGTVDTLRVPSGYANGAARDHQGRLLHCHHGLRAISRTEYDGSLTILADRYNGRRLNSPNDIAVKSDGTIWFSDPDYGLLTDYQGTRAGQELPTALYRFDPRDARLQLMSDAFTNPNGVQFSPDEKRLYVTETGDMFDPDIPRHIAVFDIADSAAPLAAPRIFATLSSGFADGLCCDEDGNLWTSAADGVHCLAPDATPLGIIHTPSLVSNLCFGGPRRNRLFLCASQTLYAIYLNTRGAITHAA